MALDFEKLSAAELMAAESAVLVMRSLTEAAIAAPHGQGMARLESALHDKGFEHLRALLAAAAASHEGAQKKMEPAVCPVPAANPPRTNAARRRTS